MDRGERGRIWWEQLRKFLDMPFGILPDMPRPSLPLHPQDLRLILEVAGGIDRGETHAFWSPYLTAESLALLARAIVVGTVGRSKTAFYSSDLAIPRIYSSLYGVATPLNRAFPMRQKLPYARSLSQIEYCAQDADSIILDGRRWRFAAQASRAVKEAERFSGARIFLLRDNWTAPGRAITSQGILVEPLTPTGKELNDGWPVLADYFRRLNNFSSGVSMDPATVLEEASPLRNLERSTAVVLRTSADLTEGGVTALLVDATNTFLQNACLPISLYKRAAAESGAAWADRYAAALKASLAYSCPDQLRGLVYGFLNDFKTAIAYLQDQHPPKVAWLKEFLLRAGENAVFGMLCTTEVEARALDLWRNSEASDGCAAVTTVTRADVDSGSAEGVLLVPGPLRSADSWMLVSGVAKYVQVLAYPWQASRWRLVSERITPLSKREMSQVNDPNAGQAEVEFTDSTTLAFAPPSSLTEDDEEDELAREVEGREHPLRYVRVRTDKGTFSYRENALVPAVELDKLVDRNVILLRPGNRIMVRADGSEIDARKRVDGFAKSDPTLAEAAERASSWRDLLTARWKAENCSPRQLHQMLFDSSEVTYQAFRDWILNPHRIGPNNRNIVLLLTRLGLEHSAAIQVREDLRKYRGYRAQAYDYLYKVCKRQASRAAGRPSQGEAIEDDHEIDPELGFTLLGLEDLVTFAAVLEPPAYEGV